MKHLRYLSIVLAGLFVHVGCECGKKATSARDASIPKWKRDPYYWYVFRDSVDRDIQHEIAGDKPGGHKKDWNEYWRWRIKIIQETADRNTREEYIIQHRRQVGLPELR